MPQHRHSLFVQRDWPSRITHNLLFYFILVFTIPITSLQQVRWCHIALPTHKSPAPPASDRKFWRWGCLTRDGCLMSARPIRTLVQNWEFYPGDSMSEALFMYLCIQQVACLLGLGVVRHHVDQRGRGSHLNSKMRIKILVGTRDWKRANGFLFWPVAYVRKPAFLWILLDILCPKNKSPLSPFKLNPDGFCPIQPKNPLQFIQVLANL